MVIQNKAQRLAYLDIAKAITIICVVLGHIPICPNIIKQIIYAFHMPCFFALAGYSWNSEENTKLTIEFVKKKAYRLLVPCMFWGILYAFPFSSKTIFMLYGNQKAFIVAKSLSSLWYLPCFFIALCLFKEVVYIVSKIKSVTKRLWTLALFKLLAVIISFFLSLNKMSYGYPWSFDVAIMSLAFIIFGHILPNYYKKIDLIAFKMQCLLFCLSCGILFLCTIWNLSFLEINNVDMASSSYGNLILFFISGCVGTVIVVGIGILVDKVSKILSKVLCFVGRNSMAIYLIHKPIVIKLSSVIDVSGGIKIIVIVCYTILSIFISCALSLFLDKYLPWTIVSKNKHLEKKNG